MVCADHGHDAWRTRRLSKGLGILEESGLQAVAVILALRRVKRGAYGDHEGLGDIEGSEQTAVVGALHVKH